MKSIRANLMLPLLAGLVLLSTVGASALYISMQRAVVKQFDDSLSDKAASLASLVHIIRNGKLEFDYSDENFAEFRRAEHPEFFQIRQTSGQTLERSLTLKGNDLCPFDTARYDKRFQSIELPGGASGRLVTIWRQALIDQDEEDPGARSANTPEEARSTPFVSISVARDTIELDRTLARLRQTIVIGVAALALIVATLVPIVVRRGLRPLDAIAQHAASLGASSLGSTFPTGNLPIELQPIVQGLNELLNRLASSFDREKRFSANAAHELRTPIAEIRAVAEVAIQWPEISRTHRALSDVVDVSERMHLLLDALLKIARAQAGEIALQPAEISPFDIAQKTLKTLDAVVQQKRLNVRLERSAKQFALSDPALASAMIGNLVANAVHHSPSMGRIIIDETYAEASVELTVLNDCPAGAVPDLKLVCEPFWTASTSRTDQRHGLGLALVREYARVLNTPIEFDLIDGKQFRATVRFKSARPAKNKSAASGEPDAALLDA